MKKKTAVIIADVFFVVVIIAVIIAGYFVKVSVDDGSIDYKFTIIEKDIEISALYAYNDRIYAGTDKGIRIYDAATFDVIHEIDNITMVYTADIVGDGDGGVWIGHERGLTHIDSGFEQTDFKYPDIPDGRVNTVAVYDGRIYCGTYNDAAVLTEAGGKWHVTDILTKKDGLPGEKIRFLYKDDYSIWITTEYDGIVIRKTSEISGFMDSDALYLTEESGLSDNEIKCISKAYGNYWLGGKYGLTIIPEEFIE